MGRSLNVPKKLIEAASANVLKYWPRPSLKNFSKLSKRTQSAKNIDPAVEAQITQAANGKIEKEASETYDWNPTINKKSEYAN